MKNLQEGNRLLKLWILGHVIKTDMALFLLFQVTHLQSNTKNGGCKLFPCPDSSGTFAANLAYLLWTLKVDGQVPMS